MTKGTSASDDVQFAFRAPKKLGQRVDRYVETVNNEQPGLGITRSGGIRALLEQALAFWESAQGVKK